METLQVLKIAVEGPVASFRYPHFVQGRHPTYEMPPPATIYGHICSAVGDWVPPDSVRFAYHFGYEARFTDYEHLHFLDRLKERKESLVPFQRDLLFNPRLTLYIDRIDWLGKFRSPEYAVVLGRSQDLMMYTNVESVTLERAEQAYFEGTLVPLDTAVQLGRGFVSVTMARYIDPYTRDPQWAQYAMIQERVAYPPPQEDTEAPTFRFIGSQLDYWVDPTTPEYPSRPGMKRAVVFHRFV